MKINHPTILLTGASGLLGRSLMAQLSHLVNCPDKLIGTAHSRAKPPLRQLDLTDGHSVRKALAEWKPSLIVHAAAERRPDFVERDAASAQRLNVGATALLAEIAAASDARFIYISTDYVFDGRTPPYADNAQPNPLNDYGRMKLAGEEVVRQTYSEKSNTGYAIVRIPILYGRVESLSESAVTELASALLKGTPFKAEDWATRYPAHADDVAHAVRMIAELMLSAEDEATGGIYQFAGAEAMTKCGMARIIAGVLGVNQALVQADPSPPAGAPRPKDCRLEPTRLHALGFTPRIKFADGVREALAPFQTPHSCP